MYPIYHFPLNHLPQSDKEGKWIDLIQFLFHEHIYLCLNLIIVFHEGNSSLQIDKC